MNSSYLGFIGGGNMATAIISGLLADGMPSDNLLIGEPDPEQQARLRDRFPGCQLSDSNQMIAARSSTLVLAVKPQVLGAVCRDIATEVAAAKPLVISIAAGVRTTDIDTWLGGGQSVVRVMPNQPALLRQGVSGLYANEQTSNAELRKAKDIVSAIGSVVEVGIESDIDIVTAISGSGPAYVYLLLKILIDNGIEMGLEPDVARELAVGTAAGSTALAADSDEPMEELIRRVRSPGGTTAAALDALEEDGVHAMFARALAAARDKATELADAAHELED